MVTKSYQALKKDQFVMEERKSSLSLSVWISPPQSLSSCPLTSWFNETLSRSLEKINHSPPQPSLHIHTLQPCLFFMFSADLATHKAEGLQCAFGCINVTSHLNRSHTYTYCICVCIMWVPKLLYDGYRFCILQKRVYFFY